MGLHTREWAKLSITRNDITHVVYLGIIPVSHSNPQYVVTYNHNDSTVTQPVLLGCVGKTKLDDQGERVDQHHGPAIVADDKGVLHVVLGSHGTPFKYTVSKRPNDSREWIPPVEFGAIETYEGLVIDKSDTLHAVSRTTNHRGQFSLHYMRKKREEDWVDLGELVVPKPTHYSIWYHKLTLDRLGRLALVYFYYSHCLTKQGAVGVPREVAR